MWGRVLDSVVSLGGIFGFLRLWVAAPTCLPPREGPSESFATTLQFFQIFGVKVEGLERVKKPEEAQASVSRWT